VPAATIVVDRWPCRWRCSIHHHPDTVTVLVRLAAALAPRSRFNVIADSWPPPRARHCARSSALREYNSSQCRRSLLPLVQQQCIDYGHYARRRPQSAVAHGDGIRESTLPWTKLPECVLLMVRSGAPSMQRGSFNADGVADLIVVNEAAINLRCCRTRRMNLQDAVNSFRRSRPTSVLGDFNGDGRADLAVSNHLAGTLGICWD